jgi:hypothetical protein
MATITRQQSIVALDALYPISQEFRRAFDEREKLLAKRDRWSTTKSARARIQARLDDVETLLRALGVEYQRLGGPSVLPDRFMLHPRDILKIRADISHGAPTIAAAIAGREARVAAMTAYGRAQGHIK